MNGLEEHPTVQSALFETFLSGIKPPMTIYPFKLLYRLFYFCYLQYYIQQLQENDIKRLTEALKSLFPLPEMTPTEASEFEEDFRCVFERGFFQELSVEQLSSGRRHLQDLFYLCMQSTFIRTSPDCLNGIRESLEQSFAELPDGEDSVLAVVHDERELERHLLLLRKLVLSPEFLSWPEMSTLLSYATSIVDAFENDHRVRRQYQKRLIQTAFDMWFSGQQKVKEFCCEFIDRWTAWEKRCDLKGEADFVGECLCHVIRMVEEATVEEIVNYQLAKIVFGHLVECILSPAWDAKHAPAVADLVIAGMRQCEASVADKAGALLGSARVLRWKAMPEKAAQLFHVFLSVNPQVSAGDSCWRLTFSLTNSFSTFMNGIRSHPEVMENISASMHSLILRAVTEPDPLEYRAGLLQRCLGDLVRKDLMAVCKPFLNAVGQLVGQESYWHRVVLHESVVCLLEMIASSLSSADNMADYATELDTILRILTEQDVIDEHGRMNCYSKQLLQTVLRIMEIGRDTTALEANTPCLLRCLKVDCETVRRSASVVLSRTSIALIDTVGVDGN